ncbi:MAG TPA: hypothetical protein VK363_17145 [Pyrinomonadaceae bacterium]|nr:hypothetical protein [Pyrinomonadaceae bacterium]
MDDDKLRYRIAYSLLVLMSLFVIAAIVALFLDGFGLLKLDKDVLIALIGATATYLAIMFLTITRHLFPPTARRSENIK